jgi:aldehyde dehydrogenase (NAD+)/retinal dehydrogenase
MMRLRNVPLIQQFVTVDITMTLLGQVPISFNKLYVNGEYIESNSKDSLTLLNPKDGTLVAEKIPIADRVDVDNAVKHAEAAFNGPWAAFTSAQRSECLRKLADLLETKLYDILLLDSLTTGNPVSLIPTREKNYIKNCLLYYGS